MMRASFLFLVATNLLLSGCKKDKDKAADPSPAAEKEAEKTPEPPKDSPADPLVGAGDCKSLKEFKSVEACIAACETGDGNACYVAGSETLVADDEPKAAELFAKGCEKGSAFACKWLAPMHAGGLGGLAKDEAKAKELTDRARNLYAPLCAQNDVQACHDLATLTDDPDKAKEIYKKACDLGNPGACDKAK